jgi:uncharacterized membrane protein YfcA
MTMHLGDASCVHNHAGHNLPPGESQPPRRARRSRRRRHPDLGEPRPCAHGRRRLPGALYALLRPAIPAVKAGGAAADAGVGFLNGVLGGITGLAGILVTIWCGLRGSPKDVLRAVFQPVAVAIFAMSALWIGARGAVTPEVIKLVLIGLPALLVGTWLGMKLFGRLDEATFRKIVLALLMASGVMLIV